MDNVTEFSRPISDWVIIIIIIIIYSLRVNHISHQPIAFHRSLRDNKSPQVSRILLSILADPNNAVVWIISTRRLISKVSLFNGIPTFVGYLMPKLFFLKNSSGTI